MPPKLTQSKAESKVENYNPEYQLKSQYTEQGAKVLFKHSCGHEYEAVFKTFFEGKNQCPKCKVKKAPKSTKKVDETELKKRIQDQVGSEYTYVKGFTKMDAKCIFHHKECDKQFEVAPKMFLGVKQTRCPKCSNKKRGDYLRDENYLQNLLDKIPEGKDYQWENRKYNFNNKELYEITHVVCGHSYKTRPNDFQQGYRCPNCIERNSNFSEPILNLKDLLDKSKVNYKMEKLFEGLIYKHSLFFDFLLTDKDILIEFDGYQHFSRLSMISEKDFKDNQIRDSIKNNWVKEQAKYKLIRIPYNFPKALYEVLIDNIINDELTNNFITKYNLYVYDPSTKLILNESSYYTCINSEYFNDSQDTIEPSLNLH